MKRDLPHFEGIDFEQRERSFNWREDLMNASQITHGLKVIGFGQSMVLGVAVIAAFSAFLYAKRHQIQKGLIG
jgi:hypothetical protein